MNFDAPSRSLYPLLIILALGCLCTTVCATARSSDDQDTICKVDMHLKHANTMYWLSRARPWSLIEATEAKEHYEEAKNLLNTLPENQYLDKKRMADDGLAQAETSLDERKEQLGAWSPYYGLLFGQDDIYEWYDDPIEVAASRIVEDLLHDGTRVHMQNDQLYLIIQSNLNDPALPKDVREAHEAVLEAAHSYINSNKRHYAISDRELAANLDQAEIKALEENPPNRLALSKLARGMSSPEMSVDRIGVLKFTHNDSIGDIHYLGGYYRQWSADPSKSEAEREWYVDGFTQDARGVEVPIYLLLFLGLLLHPVIVRTLRSGKLDQDILRSTSGPPLWSIALAIIGGFAFSALGGAGLSIANPDLEMLHATLRSLAWVAGSAVVLLVLPMLLVYVTATRFNAIAGRLGNSDMVAILLAGSWYGAQGNLAVHAAAVEGWMAAWLIFPSLLGAATLIAIARSYCQWTRTGSHWDMAATVAGMLGITMAAILEMSGGMYFSIAAAIAPPGAYLCVQAVRLIACTGRSEEPEEGEMGSIEADLLRDPPFIETNTSSRLFDGLLEEMVGEAASDDAIEIAWIEGNRGCGKTRIARELGERIRQNVADRALADDTKILFGDCNEPGDPESDIPFEPLRQAFSELMGVHRFGNPAENARRMQEGLSKIASNASVAGSAISVALDLAGGDEDSFAAANKGMIAEEMTQVLGQTVKPDADQPGGERIVLIIDDIQWIDDNSLDVLNILLERLVEQFVSGDPAMRNRICLLITSRSDYSPGSEDESDRAAATLEKLEELSQRGVVNLIRPEPIHDVLGTEENSTEWRTRLLETLRCTERAQRAITREMELKGLELPLHRLEFIKIAMEQHALKTIDGRIDLDSTTPLSSIDPGSEFKDMVANELKGLDRQLLDILHCCAVIGRSFQVSLVARIFNIDIIELLSLLKEAEQRGIVIDRTETDDIYEFRDKRIAGAFRSEPGRNPTEVQQMAREYHRRFVQVRGAELDAKYSKESAIPFTEVLAIAKHASMVSESMPMEAIRWSCMAARRCEQRRLYGRALLELNPALELIRNRSDLAIPGKERVGLLVLHAQLILDAEEQPDAALDSLEQAERFLDHVPDPETTTRHRISLLRGLAIYKQRRFAEADTAVQSIVEDQAAPAWMAARAHFIKALCMDPRAQADEKQQVLEQLFAETTTAVEESDDQEVRHEMLLLQSEICNSLGMSRLHHADDTQGAEALFNQAIELNRSPLVSDRKGEAIGHGGLGDVHMASGRTELARESYGQNLSISRETGDLGGIMRMTSMLGGIALEKSRSSGNGEEQARLLDEARRCYEESALLAIRSRATFALKFALEGLIRVEAAEGTSGMLLVQTIQDAISEDCVDAMVADAVLALVEGGELPPESSNELRTLLAPFAGTTKLQEN